MNSLNTDYGIYPLVCDEDTELDLEEAHETMTARELTKHAISLGVTPPTDDAEWVLGKLFATGKNLSGDAVQVPMGLFWSPPNYAFTVEMDRDYNAERSRTQTGMPPAT